MLFKYLSKGSPRLSYIFFIASNLSTTITIDDTTLVGHFIFVLGWHKDVFECPVSFEVYSHTMLLANVFNTFTDSWNIRNDYVASLYGFVGCSWLMFLFFSLLLLLLFEYLLNGPLGIFAMAKCLLQVFQFCFQVFWSWADGVCSMCQGLNDTILGWQMVVAVPR